MKRLTLIDYEFIIGDIASSSLKSKSSHIELRLKKNHRFYSAGTLQGIQSAKNLVDRLNLTDVQIEQRTGIYCSQFGYLHPNFDDFLKVGETSSLNCVGDFYYSIWNSHKLNPFLVTLSLSNNLLGLTSQELKMKTDCASFLRGNIGFLAALNEARLSLNYKNIDYALIMASGISCDNKNNEAGSEVFGVSLFVKLEDTQKKYSSLPNCDELYDLYRYEIDCLENLSFLKKLIFEYGKRDYHEQLQ